MARRMTVSSLRLSRALSLGTLALILSSTRAVVGQTDAPPFDIGRAFLPESTQFTPFYVTATRPLREALRDGVVSEETPLLVMNRPEGKLALATEQLTFHHVAQGDMNGSPWMVSF